MVAMMMMMMYEWEELTTFLPFLHIHFDVQNSIIRYMMLVVHMFSLTGCCGKVVRRSNNRKSHLSRKYIHPTVFYNWHYLLSLVLSFLWPYYNDDLVRRICWAIILRLQTELFVRICNDIQKLELKRVENFLFLIPYNGLASFFWSVPDLESYVFSHYRGAN